MATIDDLMNKFASPAAATDLPDPTNAVAPEPIFAVEDGQTKTASGGDDMNSLQDIYMAIAQEDFGKEAAAAASAPAPIEPDAGDVDFAKMASELAGAEASELAAGDAEEETDIVKVAAEYDAGGRIMARGFYDEFQKLAGNMDTDVTPNQNTEAESAAATPALGERGLPTVETNYAGSPGNDQKIETAGTAPKEVYKDVLKPAKTISAGQGTGDDPEAAAISLGGGSPAGFATVRDLAGGNPA